MVKKWITMILIIIILLVSCILESQYINNSFKFLENELSGYKKTIESTQEAEIGSYDNVIFVENLHEEWHKKMVGLKSLIWHSGIKDIEVGLSRIATYVKEEEKTEALAEINALIDYLDHYSEDFIISIENIL